MEILGQTPLQSILFFTLYGISGAVPLMAALYLLLRPCNTFSADIKPPVRLRRWAAAFFAFSALTHVWWLVFFIYSSDMQSLGYQLIILTDCVLLFTTIAGTMLSMLQDRRRPVWPVLVAMLPFVGFFGVYMASPSSLLQQIIVFYLLLLGLLFTIYMVFVISQYFSRKGFTYNTYINGLRINHFISRCRELAAAGQDISIQQLALESGFGSYRTFSRAFLQRTVRASRRG
jgi:hypothetical protein